MATIEQLIHDYDIEDKNREQAEAARDNAMTARHRIAEQIKAEFGPGPHNIGGRTLVVGTTRGTSFLRKPLIPPTRKPKAAAPPVETTDDATAE